VIALVGPRLRMPFLILLIVLAMGATTSMALDEVVDDYENETRVSFTYRIIQNATLDVMELNWTTGVVGYGNFTNYIEFDVDYNRVNSNLTDFPILLMISGSS